MSALLMHSFQTANSLCIVWGSNSKGGREGKDSVCVVYKLDYIMTYDMNKHVPSATTYMRVKQMTLCDSFWYKSSNWKYTPTPVLV